MGVFFEEQLRGNFCVLKKWCPASTAGGRNELNSSKIHPKPPTILLPYMFYCLIHFTNSFQDTYMGKVLFRNRGADSQTLSGPLSISTWIGINATTKKKKKKKKKKQLDIIQFEVMLNHEHRYYDHIKWETHSCQTSVYMDCINIWATPLKHRS